MVNKKKGKKQSPREFFHSQKTHPRKSLGQNFLRDEVVLVRIGEIAGLTRKDEVLEIGAGLGALTLFLGEHAGRVIAIERDKRLSERLRAALSHRENVEIVNDDALRLEFRKFYRGEKIKVVSNLPYSISSPILFKLLEEREIFSLLVLMVQQEVGERIAASPGCREYGSLSVFLQAYMDVGLELKVPPEAFWPRPKVNSVVLRLVPLERPKIPIPDQELFRKVVKASFSSRRKILSNSLRSLLPKESVEKILESSGIDGKRRAETLSLEEFGRLTEVVYRNTGHDFQIY